MSVDFDSKAILRWRYAGLECAICPGPMAHLNGYVRLPESFHARKVHYDDLDVEVHGGLTYGMDDNGWVGWDTAHLGDFIPGHDTSGRRWDLDDVRMENDDLATQVAKWCEDHPDFEGQFTQAERLERAREGLRRFAAERAKS